MKSLISIFTKAPIPGLVKTRLARNTCLSENNTAQLARAMLKDTISLSSKTSARSIQIGLYPAENHDMIMDIVDSIRADGKLDKEIEYFHQVGTTFDQRFASVVKASFEGNVDCTVVLGADLPYLDPCVINKVFEDISSNIHDKVIMIGPSYGGGIYLVGITKVFDPEWFEKYQLFTHGIELNKFASLCKEKQFKVYMLPPYGDIDVEEDLVSLISYINILTSAKNTVGFYFPYYTAEIIERLGLFIVEEKGQTRKRTIARKK